MESLRDGRFDRFQIAQNKVQEAKAMMNENLQELATVNFRKVQALDVECEGLRAETHQFMKKAYKKKASCCVLF